MSTRAKKAIELLEGFISRTNRYDYSELDSIGTEHSYRIAASPRRRKVVFFVMDHRFWSGNDYFPLGSTVDNISRFEVKFPTPLSREEKEMLDSAFNWAVPEVNLYYRHCRPVELAERHYLKR